MATHKQAIKRHRQSLKRRRRNLYFLSTMRTAIKRVRKAADHGNASDAKKEMKTALNVLDRAAQKGVVHKNNASRTKSRLVRLVIGL